VDETKKMTDEMPVSFTSAIKTTANGLGVKYCLGKAEFVITAKDAAGHSRGFGGDVFAVESKEAEVKATILDKNNGNYEVQYSAAEIEGEHFSLAVTLRGHHICGSPFSVVQPGLLLELSSHGNHSKDWLDAAVATMSGIPAAQLWVELSDVNGSVVYNATGKTNFTWTQDYMTCRQMKQSYDYHHKDAIRFDNGDVMMIVGKNATTYWNGVGGDIYRPYNIIINAGWGREDMNSWFHRRRMIISREAKYVPGWSTPDNVISFDKAGFMSTPSTNWPKFIGTFRILYTPL